LREDGCGDGDGREDWSSITLEDYLCSLQCLQCIHSDTFLFSNFRAILTYNIASVVEVVTPLCISLLIAHLLTYIHTAETAIMGISRDSRHKRSATGAKRAYYSA